MYDNGHVYAGTYEGWYCPRCADFKTEAELVEGNRCPIHLIELEREKEDNWFFSCPPSRSRSSGCTPSARSSCVPREPLQRGALVHQARASTTCRSPARACSWGVPVPWDETQVIYVWFDALLNYYSALSYAREGEDLTERFWPADVHLIGKDILKFHAVIWPAMLMAAGIEVPRAGVRSTASCCSDEHKMSKSLGNVIDPFQVIDALRRRRAALLPDARGRASARTARSRPRASRRATRPSSPTSTATSPAARWR